MLPFPDYDRSQLELDLNLGKIYLFRKMQIFSTRTMALSVLGLTALVCQILAMAASPAADTAAPKFQVPAACKVCYWPMAGEK